VGQKTPREAAEGGRERQGEEAGAEEGYPGHLRRDGVFPEGDARRPQPGAEKASHHQERSQEAKEHRPRGGGHGDPRQPPGAVGEGQVFQEDPEGLAEAQDGDGEVVAPQPGPQGGDADDKARQGGRRHSHSQG